MLGSKKYAAHNVMAAEIAKPSRTCRLAPHEREVLRPANYSGPRAIIARVLATVPMAPVEPVRGLDTQAERQLINPNDKAMTTARTTRALIAIPTA